MVQRVPTLAASRVRRGFTLLELLLVLAVMAVIAGVSWPRMMRYMTENALRQNVELVRRELAATRIRAIESGLSYQFRYEPAKQTFVILPFDRPETVATDDPTAEPARVKTLEGIMSSDCSFVPPRGAVGEMEGGQRLNEVWLALLKNGALYQDTVWSQPILFRPNGEGQDAQLTIQDKIGNSVLIKVRGLTGAVTVDRLRRPETQP